MNLTGKTITGRRSHNEDAFCVFSGNGRVFAAVSDGMGGHAAGETASRLSIDAVKSQLANAEPISESALSLAFSEANRSVWETSQSVPALNGMGATLVAAVPFPACFLAANVGDSRLYLYHDGTIRQISHDHSYVAQLVRYGIITSAEAKTHPSRNLITRAIGTEPDVKTDLFSSEWEPGDILLLCSDGLSGSIDDERMCDILKGRTDLDAACEALISCAFENGSTDNITVVLLENTEAAK